MKKITMVLGSIFASLFLISLVLSSPLLPPRLPMASYGWIAVDGEPAPIETEIGIWNGIEWVWIQDLSCNDECSYPYAPGWYDIIFGGSGEIYVNGEPTGQIIEWEEGEILNLNIDAGYPKLNPASWDVYVIDDEGNPFNCTYVLFYTSGEIVYDASRFGAGHWRNHNFMPMDYDISVCGYWNSISLAPGQEIEIELNKDTGEWEIRDIGYDYINKIPVLKLPSREAIPF